MLKYGYYIENKLDRAWFDSSNVVYAECDESEHQEKTVRVVFKNGLVYQYENVNLYDWLSFKRADSQGKALNEYFKKDNIQYKKLNETKDIKSLNEEYEFRINNGITLKYLNQTLTIVNNEDKEIYSMEINEYNTVLNIVDMIKVLGHNVKFTNLNPSC